MLRTRHRRGLGLFGALLALALLGMMVLAAIAFLESRSHDRRSRLAATQVLALAAAARSHASASFPDLLARARTAPFELTLAELRAAGALADGFADIDALGRSYRVLVLAAGAGAFDVAVTETVPDGDRALPWPGLLESRGDARLGLVAPDAPGRLAGPAISADIRRFQTAFSGAPATGALAVLGRFDHGSVYGSQLYRVPVPGFPDANRMAADLDMGGHDITNAAAIESGRLAVADDLEVGGDFAVAGDLVVGQAVRAAGAAEIAGELRAAAARFSGAVESASLSAAGELRAARISSAGAVTAASIGAAGAVAAGSATVSSLQSARVTARAVTAQDVSASSATARTVRAGHRIEAEEAGFSTLRVGACTGC